MLGASTWSWLDLSLERGALLLGHSQENCASLLHWGLANIIHSSGLHRSLFLTHGMQKLWHCCRTWGAKCYQHPTDRTVLLPCRLLLENEQWLASAFLLHAIHEAESHKCGDKDWSKCMKKGQFMEWCKELWQNVMWSSTKTLTVCTSRLYSLCTWRFTYICFCNIKVLPIFENVVCSDCTEIGLSLKQQTVLTLADTFWSRWLSIC